MPPILLWMLAKGKALGGVLTALWRWLWANPWRWSLIVVAALCWRLWAIDADRDSWRAKHGALVAEGERIDRQNKTAGAAGVAAASIRKGEINAGNERARTAAAGSDDPLAAGFDSLRAEGDRAAGPSAR